MFNFFKYKKENPYKYKMLCRNCDIFFKTDNPEKVRECPVCGQSKRVEVYSLVNKETGQEIK